MIRRQAGWDGLTTNQGAFQKLFALRPENVSVCAVWAGDLDPEDPNVEFQWSTKRFLELIPAIAAAKLRLSHDFELLRELTYERNTHRWAKETRHVCVVEGCNAVFSTAAGLRTYRYREHQALESEEAKQADKVSKTCRYCGKTYARKDTSVRHEKTCSSNPDREAPSANQPISKRRRTVDPTQVPILSGGAVKSYEALTEEEAPGLPRINIDSPTFYRGERFCRYPGCEFTTRHAKPSALRLHYKNRHRGFMFPIFSTTVAKAIEAEHEQGLFWLSTCVFRGKVEGNPPVVSSR
ncbi:uncharacterized protein N7482_007287 [Penicillium canariense]|uniref:Uncharacterized protein n=1 Tax=Penicillium canariense TaxID=189055 RepID=A0A9W9HWK8_9EURO|nr:uncharacterized protein N7482_007287 [Penicillium canariense]KAJ5160283.1 hypothetical protein N7482_007287 [Penicillium canariense]